MIRNCRVFAAAAATVALVAAGTAPALAERAHHKDARKDVVGASISGPDDVTRLPGNKNADVTKVVMRHSPNRVIMRTHFRDLNRTSFFSVYDIRTDKGRYQAMQMLGSEDIFLPPTVNRELGLSDTAARAFRAAARGTGTGERFMLIGPGGPVECADLTYWAHRREDVARMSIARSCLGNPKWVRLGEAVLSADMKRETLAVDDALRKGFDLSNSSGFTVSRRLQHP